MKIDISKPVQFHTPTEGEEGLIFEVVNYNDVTNRATIRPTNLKEWGEGLIPTQVVSIEDLKNVKQDTTEAQEFDLMHNWHELPEEIQNILLSFNEEENGMYNECKRVIAELEQHGYTAEYDLSGELYDLKKTIETDHLNHFDLRSEFENGDLQLMMLSAEGKISESPETWAIDHELGGSYLYESETEYLQDVEILGLPVNSFNEKKEEPQKPLTQFSRILKKLEKYEEGNKSGRFYTLQFYHDGRGFLMNDTGFEEYEFSDLNDIESFLDEELKK